MAAAKSMKKSMPFERSTADREKRGMREGSVREEAMDRRQAAKAGKSGMPKKGMSGMGKKLGY